MSHQSIHAPWRMQYIRSLENADSTHGGCFFCQAVARLDDPEQVSQRMVLWASEHSIVMMNKFPYTSGHVLVAPREHRAEFSDCSDAQLLDIQIQTRRVVELIKKVLNPQGLNIGINLGRCAGAGLPGHLHQHIVPRWAGDANFMSVVGDVRVIPEALRETYGRLLEGSGFGVQGSAARSQQP